MNKQNNDPLLPHEREEAYSAAAIGKHELGCQYARDGDDDTQHVGKIVR